MPLHGQPSTCIPSPLLLACLPLWRLEGSSGGHVVDRGEWGQCGSLLRETSITGSLPSPILPAPTPTQHPFCDVFTGSWRCTGQRRLWRGHGTPLGTWGWTCTGSYYLGAAQVENREEKRASRGNRLPYSQRTRNWGWGHIRARSWTSSLTRNVFSCKS